MIQDDRNAHSARLRAYLAAVFTVGMLFLVLASRSIGDDVSTGPDGINSFGTGLSGEGVAIGQMEISRPGKHNFDAPDRVTSAFDVFRVFTVDGPGIPDFNDPPQYTHATFVAGVMLSNPDNCVPAQGCNLANPGVLRSVSSHANLYSTALHNQDIPIYSVENWLLGAQKIALEDNGVVRAINASWYDAGSLVNGEMNGTAFVTLGLDWSARRHNVLYVISRGNLDFAGPPADLYNGIVVGATKKDAQGTFAVAWEDNATLNAEADTMTRRVTSILAPGAGLTLVTYDALPGQIRSYPKTFLRADVM